MSKITIWGRKSSVNAPVFWCLDELILHITGLMQYLPMAWSPQPIFGNEPDGEGASLLDAEGLVIFEAGAILRYLATQYAAALFWPKAPAALGLVEKE